ncbi:MAG: hypothetical protein Fur0023_05800 [Bacteroidia bacterium]
MHGKPMCIIVFILYFNFVESQQNLLNKITIPIKDSISHVPDSIYQAQANVFYNNKIFVNNSTYLQNLNSPDFPIFNSPNITHSENSIFISPLSGGLYLNSNNYSTWPTISDLSVSGQSSVYMGNLLFWVGPFGGLNNSRADPSVVINKNGIFFVNYVDKNYGQSISRSSDFGNTWIEFQIAPNPGTVADKNHLWVDNSTFKQDGALNPNKGNLYAAWTDFGGIFDNQIVLSRSNNDGLNWSNRIDISSSVNAGSHNQGVNIQTGPNGEVYACWAIYDCWPCNESSIGFTKSYNGGLTWVPASRITSINGTRNNPLGGGKNMRHNSFPVMSVNQQNGHIYITWTQQTQSNNSDIYLIRSIDGGNNWSSPINVTPITGDQYLPWIACDEITNAIVVVYYDSRNFQNNNRVETFASISYDDGNTWWDYQISDIGADWDGNGIPGFAQNYAGDYIGIDVLNGRAVPVWSDKRAGNMLAYTQPFDIPCPNNLDLKYGNYFITDEVSFSEDAAYSATNKIYVAGQTTNNSTYKIYPNASVYMSAGTEIELDDGFESEGEFVAEIAPCTNISSRMNNSVSKNLTDNKNILLYSVPSNDVMKNESSFCRIFPNPAQSSIYITSLTNIHSVFLKDLTGKVLLQQTFSPPSITESIDVSALSNGLYLAEIHTSSSVVTEKVVVQR